MPSKTMLITTLRQDLTITREALLIEDQDHVQILAVRQTKYDDNGAMPESKIIRFTASEADLLCGFWQKNRKEIESGKRA